MDSKNSSTTVPTNWVMCASNIFEPVLLVPEPRFGTSGHSHLWLKALRALLVRSCGADVEDHQSVLWTLWRVRRRWSIAIPAEFRAPVPHEIALSVAVSAWLHKVPELSFLKLLSFHCLLRPAEAGQLRCWDLNMFRRCEAGRRQEGTHSAPKSISARIARARCKSKVDGPVWAEQKKKRRTKGKRAVAGSDCRECGCCEKTSSLKASACSHKESTTPVSRPK